MMYIDFFTLFIISSLFNFIFIIFLLIIWLNHRKDFNGIGLFCLGMLAMLFGNFGLSLQNYLPPIISEVFSNTIITAAFTLLYLGLKYFFKKNTSKSIVLGLLSFPIAVLIEQSIFTFVFPNIIVRLYFVSCVILLLTGRALYLLIRTSKNLKISGVLLIINFGLQIITTVTRLIGVILNPAIIASYSNHEMNWSIILIWTLISFTWPTGFAMLISYHLQQKEKKRSFEKSLLLNELFHRTKNNMQTILSFISLQLNTINSLESKAELQKIESRIQSMAIVHKKLYEAQNLSKIPVRDYIKELVDWIVQTFVDKGQNISVEYIIENLLLTIETVIPLGLIINEATTNIVKYAFKNKQGNIKIEFSQDSDKKLFLCITDNGIGFPPDFDPYNNGSLGLNTIINLTQSQLNGTIHFESQNGLKLLIEFEGIQPPVKFK